MNVHQFFLDLTRRHANFGRKAPLDEQARAYRVTFNNLQATRFVVPDLMEYAGVGRPLPSDRDEMLRIAGRQDIWHRIQGHLNFTPAEMVAMLKGQPVMRQQNE